MIITPSVPKIAPGAQDVMIETAHRLVRLP